MTAQHTLQLNSTPEQLENARIVAALAHATAPTPKAREIAWGQLEAVRRQIAERVRLDHEGRAA